MKLTLKKLNDRYGYVDEKGNWVIEPNFLYAEEFDRGLALVRPNGLFGYLKEDGTWLVEPTLHYALPFDGEIAGVMKGLFWGLINRRGEWVVEPTLRDTSEFKYGLCKVETADKLVGYIDNKGKWIIPPVTKGLQFFGLDSVPEGMIMICVDKKFGFYDLEGNLAIPPRFEDANDFYEGVAAARDPETRLYGYIDKSGAWAIKPQFVKARDFRNERAVVRVRCEGEQGKITRYTLIDRFGKILAEPIFFDIRDAYFKKGPYAVMEVDGYYGVIDRDGRIVIKPEYDRVSQHDSEDGCLWILDKKDKWGLANTEKVLVRPKYSFLELSHDEVFRVEVKNKWGFINREGVEVLKPVYDSLSTFEDGVAEIKINGEKGWIDRDFNLLGGRTFEETREFGQNGLAPVKADGLWGFINKAGQMVVEPQFDELGEFSDGTALASVAGHWGSIDSEGNWLIEPEFDELLDFADGMAAARIFVPKLRSARWGYINRDGQWVIKPTFEKARSFTYGTADVKSDSKWGRIDAEGNWVIEPRFDDIERWSEELSRAEHEGHQGVIDDAGKWLLQPEYDEFKLGKDDMIWLWRDGKMGFAKTDGTLLVKPDKYDEIGDFDPKLSTLYAKIKSRYGILDRDGNELVAPVLTGSTYFDSRNNGYRIAKSKRKWGILDMNKGNWIIEPEFDDFRTESTPAIVWFQKDDKWGLMDLSGKWVLPPVFDNYKFYDKSSSCNGKAPAESGGRTGIYDLVADKWVVEPLYDSAWVYDDYYSVKLDGKETWLRYDGSLLTGEWYDEVESFRDGIAMVIKDGKYGFIRKDGTWVVEPVYDGFDIYVHAPGHIKAFFIVVGRDKEGDEIRKYGFVDPKGTLLAGRMFDGVYDFSTGLAKVKDGNLYGYIDITGKIIIEPKFKKAGPFMDNRAAASLNGKTYGYIDRTGEWKIKPQFEEAENFAEGGDPANYAVVKKNGKWGIIDLDGNLPVDCIYDSIGNAAVGVYRMELDGKWGYITRKGVVLAEPIYDKAADFGLGYGDYPEPLGKVTLESPGLGGETKTLYITLKGEVRKNYKRR